MTSPSINSVSRISLLFFLLAATLGLLMRLFWLIEIPFFEYRHILHSHSHTALFGWAFTAVGATLVFLFTPNSAKEPRLRYTLLAHVFACLGMFVGFLYQGYGPVSIAFSTLAVVIIYRFAYIFLRDLRTLEISQSKVFAKWAIYWLLVSTIGLWLIAPVQAILGKLHPAYYGSIQFFLHFQFNGWLTFGVLAVIFKYCERENLSVRLANWVFPLLQTSLILTYALSVSWSTPESLVFYLNSLGVILQVVAFAAIVKTIFKASPKWLTKPGLGKTLIKLGLFSLILKVLVQVAVAVPYIAKVSYTIHNFVIGFIHLAMIGSVSLIILAVWYKMGVFRDGRATKIGFGFLMLGFVLTELILFGQGILLWAKSGFISAYYDVLFWATLFLPLSLIIILLNTTNLPNYKNQ